MGQTIRDRRSGVFGKVIGVVRWADPPSTSFIVQPPVRDDRTVPPTVYVPTSAAEEVPQVDMPKSVN